MNTLFVKNTTMIYIRKSILIKEKYIDINLLNLGSLDAILNGFTVVSNSKQNRKKLILYTYLEVRKHSLASAASEAVVEGKVLSYGLGQMNNTNNTKVAQMVQSHLYLLHVTYLGSSWTYMYVKSSTCMYYSYSSLTRSKQDH
jgi:hypothetical protein